MSLAPRRQRVRLAPLLVPLTLGVAVAAGVGGCAFLQQLQLPVDPVTGTPVVPPKVTFTGATLARAPSRKMLAAYYCPRVVKSELAFGGVGGGGVDILCRGLFGPPPRPEDSQIAFDLHFNVANPNQIPLPLGEILTAVTVFPAATNQSLGAVCVKLCAPGDAACTGVPDATSCQASSRDIRSLADFRNAAAGFLISQGLTLLAGGQPTFVAPRVNASANIDVVVRYALAPEAMLPVMEQLAREAVGELKAGRDIEFKIPYRIEGTVWADAGSLGRLAVGFGPMSSEWVIPTEAILRAAP